jgi:anti-sigma factor RsiW
MKCPIDSRESEILVAYSSGLLESEQTPMLAAHVEMCPACQKFVDHQRTVWDTLDVWQAPPVSADFNRRLYQKLEQPSSWFERLMHSLQWSGLRQAIPIAASAGVILMAGLLLQHNYTPPQTASHDTPAVEAIQPEELENALSEMEALSQLSRHVDADNTDSKM